LIFFFLIFSFFLSFFLFSFLQILKSLIHLQLIGLGQTQSAKMQAQAFAFLSVQTMSTCVCVCVCVCASWFVCLIFLCYDVFVVCWLAGFKNLMKSI
jgi:hypothetical protein